MAQVLTLDLTPKQQEELETVRDQHELPYLRERAAALLKIADGEVVHQVALKGLHKKRDPDTLYSWLHRYQAEGVAGLFIRKGRGRKAAFSPSV